MRDYLRQNYNILGIYLQNDKGFILPENVEDPINTEEIHRTVGQLHDQSQVVKTDVLIMIERVKTTLKDVSCFLYQLICRINYKLQLIETKRPYAIPAEILEIGSAFSLQINTAKDSEIKSDKDSNISK